MSDGCWSALSNSFCSGTRGVVIEVRAQALPHITVGNQFAQEEKSLTQQYTKELAAQETQLGALRAEISDLEARQKLAQQGLDTAVESVAFDINL